MEYLLKRCNIKKGLLRRPVNKFHSINRIYKNTNLHIRNLVIIIRLLR